GLGFRERLIHLGSPATGLRGARHRPIEPDPGHAGVGKGRVKRPRMPWPPAIPPRHHARPKERRAMSGLQPHPIALTIAGSDSGGGAGIQADRKAFSALGVYGASVITAITAQNTRTVAAVEAVSPAMVAAQIDAVFGDLDVRAVKIGMVGGVDAITVVADRLAALLADNPVPVVLD